MVKHVVGDLLSGDVDIIAHQVNCRGVMGSGVALQIREMFPDVYDSYRNFVSQVGIRSLHSTPTRAQLLLGKNQYVETTRKDRHIIVANLFAQDSFGCNGRYMDYRAFCLCMRALRRYALFESCLGRRIGLPYKIGCDRGGGNWDVVYQIICEELHGCNVTLFELPKE